MKTLRIEIPKDAKFKNFTEKDVRMIEIWPVDKGFVFDDNMWTGEEWIKVQEG